MSISTTPMTGTTMTAKMISRIPITIMTTGIPPLPHRHHHPTGVRIPIMTGTPIPTGIPAVPIGTPTGKVL